MFVAFIVVSLLITVFAERAFRAKKISRLRKIILYITASFTPLVSAVIVFLLVTLLGYTADAGTSSTTVGIYTWGIDIAIATITFIFMVLAAWRIGQIPFRKSLILGLVYVVVLIILLFVFQVIGAYVGRLYPNMDPGC